MRVPGPFPCLTCDYIVSCTCVRRLYNGAVASAWHVVLAVLPVVSLLIVAAGTVGGSFRISRSSRTLAIYRDAAQAWETRAGVLESENDDLKEQVRELRAELASHRGPRRPR